MSISLIFSEDTHTLLLYCSYISLIRTRIRRILVLRVASSNSVRIVFNTRKRSERHSSFFRNSTSLYLSFSLMSFRSSFWEFWASAGKNGRVSSSSGNRATFAELPRLFGDSCANLFRARNPICLRLIVLLPPAAAAVQSLTPLPPLSCENRGRGDRAANYYNPPMIEWESSWAF